MNTKNIAKNIKHFARVTGRFMHKHGPAIATFASTACTIGGTVWACKKTLAVQYNIHAYAQEREELKEDKQALRKSYISEAGFLAKEFAGPAAAIVGGEVLKYGAYRSQKNTIGQLTLGIAALQTQVNDLKKDIYGKMGEEKADKLTRGTVEEEVEDETCETNIYASRIKGLSPYAVIFDENHPWWREDPLYRYHNFAMEQAHLNDLLVARSTSPKKKVVLTNEIYERLMYPDTELGSHSGYCFKPQEHPEVDNVIQFIFIDPDTGKRITDFPNGIEKPVYIDFNIDYGYVTQFMEVC